MNKMRAFIGYSIVAIVLVAGMVTLSRMSASPWLKTVVAAFAVAAAIRFVDSLSIMVVGILVVVLTALLPLGFLFAIGMNSGLSPTSYLKFVDVIQAVLPTLVAVLFLAALKRKNSASK